ncbi:melatonin receptor type 1B-B-like [Apostichopus japonicus]|uniref:melatonin receptor type 1B-B-like n=1 Tax=Stichopus japonicus TaxID=307972 RepID=UPI003AB58D00
MMESVEVSNTSTLPEYIPKAVRIADAVILLCISLTGIIGNVLTSVAYILSHKLRTKTNIFVINLAIADFLTCLFLPFVSWSLVKDVVYIEPQFDIICGFVIAAITIFASTSIIFLFSIAVNRYVLITKSHHEYERFYRTRNIAIWLFVSWTYPVLVNLVPLLFGVGHLGFDIKIHACGARTDHEHSHLYDLLVVISFVPMPFLVTVCYVGIYLHIRRHNRRMVSYNLSLLKSRSCSQNDPQSSRSAVTKTDKSKTREIAPNHLAINRNLFLVLVIYLVCLSPHIIGEIVNAPYYVILHTTIIVACNSCLNPIIYGVKHPHFRQVFKSIILCRWSEIPQPAYKWMAASQQAHYHDVKMSTHVTLDHEVLTTP